MLCTSFPYNSLWMGVCRFLLCVSKDSDFKAPTESSAKSGPVCFCLGFCIRNIKHPTAPGSETDLSQICQRAARSDQNLDHSRIKARSQPDHTRIWARFASELHAPWVCLAIHHDSTFCLDELLYQAWEWAANSLLLFVFDTLHLQCFVLFFVCFFKAVFFRFYYETDKLSNNKEAQSQLSVYSVIDVQLHNTF